MEWMDEIKKWRGGVERELRECRAEMLDAVAPDCMNDILRLAIPPERAEAIGAIWGMGGDEFYRYLDDRVCECQCSCIKP
jgi:hypothetical protein